MDINKLNCYQPSIESESMYEMDDTNVKNAKNENNANNENKIISELMNKLDQRLNPYDNESNYKDEKYEKYEKMHGSNKRVRNIDNEDELKCPKKKIKNVKNVKNVENVKNKEYVEKEYNIELKQKQVDDIKSGLLKFVKEFINNDKRYKELEKIAIKYLNKMNQYGLNGLESNKSIINAKSLEDSDNINDDDEIIINHISDKSIKNVLFDNIKYDEKYKFKESIKINGKESFIIIQENENELYNMENIDNIEHMILFKKYIWNMKHNCMKKTNSKINDKFGEYSSKINDKFGKYSSRGVEKNMYDYIIENGSNLANGIKLSNMFNEWKEWLIFKIEIMQKQINLMDETNYGIGRNINDRLKMNEKKYNEFKGLDSKDIKLIKEMDKSIENKLKNMIEIFNMAKTKIEWLCIRILKLIEFVYEDGIDINETNKIYNVYKGYKYVYKRSIKYIKENLDSIIKQKQNVHCEDKETNSEIIDKIEIIKQIIEYIENEKEWYKKYSNEENKDSKNMVKREEYSNEEINKSNEEINKSNECIKLNLKYDIVIKKICIYDYINISDKEIKRFKEYSNEINRKKSIIEKMKEIELNNIETKKLNESITMNNNERNRNEELKQINSSIVNERNSNETNFNIEDFINETQNFEMDNNDIFIDFDNLEFNGEKQKNERDNFEIKVTNETKSQSETSNSSKVKENIENVKSMENEEKDIEDLLDSLF